jgi:hypothetical protein
MAREPIRSWNEQHPRDCQRHNDSSDPARQPSGALRPSSPALQHVQDVRGISPCPPGYGRVSISPLGAVNNGWLVTDRLPAMSSGFLNSSDIARLVKRTNRTPMGHAQTAVGRSKTA